MILIALVFIFGILIGALGSAIYIHWALSTGRRAVNKDAWSGVDGFD